MPFALEIAGAEIPGSPTARASRKEREDLTEPADPVMRKDFNKLTDAERMSFKDAVLKMMKLDCPLEEKDPKKPVCCTQSPNPPACEQVEGKA
jgi:hypothetical protein